MTKGNTYRLSMMSIVVAILTLSLAAHGKGATTSTGSYTDDLLESEIAAYMKQDPNQQRSSLHYNAILAEVARQRAYDMGVRGYFAHVSPDGIGANSLVTQAGYILPDFYASERSGNNIESIAAGNATAEATWQQWMGSPGHRTHILGLEDFYAAQTDYGIGHAFVPGSRYTHYWVIITARHGVRSSSTMNHTNTNISTARRGSASPYPHVIRAGNGQLEPASGYRWVDEDDPNDFRVKLMPGLILADGKYSPAAGYDWVNPDDPRDLRVERTR